ncbi:hypothetical protein D1007_42736 [Hordeum vulgare]|nr:hypothetical protein D1007_42736 [Hordeum vulgare]
MEEHAPVGLWQQPHDCCNGPTWVATEFNSLGFMFWRYGWKSFALAQGLQEGHILHFKFDEATTLFMKAFRSVGGRVDWCMQGDSSGRSRPSDIDGSEGSSSRGSRGDNDYDCSPGAHVKEEGSD